MENREDEIVRSFIERAEEERNNLLREIERLETQVLPMAREDFTNASKAYTDMARQLNVNFEANSEMKTIISTYLNNLNTLKTELNKLEIEESTLLEDTVIEKAQRAIPLIEMSLIEAKSNLYNSNKNNLLKSFEQRQNIESQIADLNGQKMYLQGKLDNTWRRKTKREIEQKIAELDAEIDSLKSKLAELDFKEDIPLPSKSTEIQVQKENEQNTETLGNNEEIERTRARRW